MIGFYLALMVIIYGYRDVEYIYLSNKPIKTKEQLESIVLTSSIKAIRNREN